MAEVTKKEVPTPPEIFTTLLEAARGTELVLVGGQALAVWLDYYRLTARLPNGVMAVSDDVDFLTRSAADKWVVSRFVQALHGRSIYPSWRAMTALVGQAVLDISNEELVNVDVIFSVVGLNADKVRERAVVMDDVRVMHPLDVLYSRLVNLYKLPVKQTTKGEHQLRLGIDVAREFLRERAARGNVRSEVLPTIKLLTRWARDDAGTKVAERFGVHVADAIDPQLVPAGSRFWIRFWPHVKELMSNTYVEQLGLADAPSRHVEK